MQCSDGGLRLELAEAILRQCMLEDSYALCDERGVPQCPILLVEAHEGHRQRSSVPVGGRGGAA